MYLEAHISIEPGLGNWEQMGKSHVRGGNASKPLWLAFYTVYAINPTSE